MSKKYAITYVVKSKRTAIITADSEEEAENMIEQDYDYYDFTEEDTEFYDIEDIEEISDPLDMTFYSIGEIYDLGYHIIPNTNINVAIYIPKIFRI